MERIMKTIYVRFKEYGRNYGYNVPANEKVEVGDIVYVLSKDEYKYAVVSKANNEVYNSDHNIVCSVLKYKPQKGFMNALLDSNKIDIIKEKIINKKIFKVLDTTIFYDNDNFDLNYLIVKILNRLNITEMKLWIKIDDSYYKLCHKNINIGFEDEEEQISFRKVKPITYNDNFKDIIEQCTADSKEIGRSYLNVLRISCKNIIDYCIIRNRKDLLNENGLFLSYPKECLINIISDITDITGLRCISTGTKHTYNAIPPYDVDLDLDLRKNPMIRETVKDGVRNILYNTYIRDMLRNKLTYKEYEKFIMIDLYNESRYEKENTSRFESYINTYLLYFETRTDAGIFKMIPIIKFSLLYYEDRIFNPLCDYCGNLNFGGIAYRIEYIGDVINDEKWKY